MDGETNPVVVHLLLLLAQFLIGFNYVLTRMVLTNGLDRTILSFYRDILALCTLVPGAYFMDRGNPLKLTWKLLLQLMFLGFVGIYGSNYLLYVAIEYTSAEAAAAVQPFLPVLVALIAIILGTERVGWKSREGQVKVLGILSSCIGALVVTFYIGPVLIQKSVHHLSPPGLTADGMQSLDIIGREISGWQLGSICAVGSSVALAIYVTFQAPLVQEHSAVVSVVAYSYAFGALFMGLTAWITVPNSDDWALKWNSNLFAVVYNGVVISALVYAVLGWCMARVGAVVVACYLPLQPVVAAILALLFIGTKIYLGSIVGAVFFLIGLILISWAKAQSDNLDFTSRLLDGQESPARHTLTDPLIQVGRP